MQLKKILKSAILKGKNTSRTIRERTGQKKCKREKGRNLDEYKCNIKKKIKIYIKHEGKDNRKKSEGRK